ERRKTCEHRGEVLEEQWKLLDRRKPRHDAERDAGAPGEAHRRPQMPRERLQPGKDPVAHLAPIPVVAVPAIERARGITACAAKIGDAVERLGVHTLEAAGAN